MKAHSRKDARAKREEIKSAHMHHFLEKNPEVVTGDTKKFADRLSKLEKTPTVLFPKEGAFSKRVLVFVADKELDDVVDLTTKQAHEYIHGQPSKKIIEEK